ncbi:GAF domain-containing protein [Kineococcus indalonis]|uniref:GAF domain-containing protein n=1 Tax=Kineococcus indalonis TaxID=2696566 RepID=UPI001411B65C|nr:GAF domain-containing protein [Kineococcus indalonis]NAZ88231.1 GAF domain-containing protein [Kineococcus indalonis]
MSTEQHEHDHHEPPGPGREGSPEWYAWVARHLASAQVVTDDALYDHDRLDAVAALRADDVEHVQPLVDDLLARAAGETGAPVALLNVVLTGAQVIAGAHGLSGWMAETRATPAEWALCARVVRSGEELVVPDTTADPTTRENPLTTVDGLHAYAGVPLRGRGGQVLGTVCVMDDRPRPFSEGDLAVLREAAEQAARRLEDAGGS